MQLKCRPDGLRPHCSIHVLHIWSPLVSFERVKKGREGIEEGWVRRVDKCARNSASKIFRMGCTSNAGMVH